MRVRVLLLHGAQLHSDDQLGLGGHVFEDVGLQSSQHVRPQQIVELFDLVLFGDVSKLFQKALQITAEEKGFCNIYLKTANKVKYVFLFGGHT